MLDSKRNTYGNERDDLLARSIIQENSGGKDPEISLVEDFLEELDTRLEQAKIYLPIVDMLRKRKREESVLQLIPELCFLLLSYLIYEGKLKHKGISFQDIETFLTKAWRIMGGTLPEQTELSLLTSNLLDGLQNDGRNFVLNAYCFKTGNFREKYVKFLEIKQANDNTLQYYVTDQGVDFYLKTKEFPDETKITINLLLFQKQMEKGAFGFAYETVRRLNMEVQKKKDRKYSLLEAMAYGRLDSGAAYDLYHKSIVNQFEEEAELFNTAVKNVGSAFSEYVEKIHSGNAESKDERTLTLLKIIEKEIGRAQTLHTELLKEAVRFTGEYDKALVTRRKAIFTERFHFQNEFERIVTKQETPAVLKYLFEPLMNPNIRKSFNPLRTFEPQRTAKEPKAEMEERQDDVRVERMTIDMTTAIRIKQSFVFYASQLLAALDTPEQQIFLQDFCGRLEEKYSQDSVYNGDFISFILEMNREKRAGDRSRIISFADAGQPVDAELKTIEAVFRQAAGNYRSRHAIEQISVTSFPDQDVELLPGLKVTNMLFTGVRQ